MDDRLAVHVYQDNFMERLGQYRDRISLLEKQSISTTGAPGSGLLTVGSPANGLSIYGQVLSLTTPGSDKSVIFNDGGVFGGESTLTFDKASRKLYIGDGTASPVTGGLLDIVKVDTFETTPLNIFARSDDGWGVLNFTRFRSGVFSLLDDDTLGRIDFYGNANNTLTDVVARMEAYAAQDFTTGWNGTEMAFSVVDVNATTLTKKLIVNYDLTTIKNTLSMDSNYITNLLDPSNPQDAATKAYTDALVVGLWDDRGNFDASVNAYPSSGGSGTAGVILKGDIWTISVAGTLPTAQAVEVGDTVRALVDTPGNAQADWAIQQNNLTLPLSAANGGTGQSSYAVGDLLVASGATALSKLADVAAGQPLLSGGVGAAPGYAGYTFAGTAAKTYTFPIIDDTLAGLGTENIFTVAQRIDLAVGVPLTVTDTVTPAAALITSDRFVFSDNALSPGVSVIHAGATTASRSVFKGVRAGGTTDTPTAPADGSYVASLVGAIYDGVTTQSSAMVNLAVDDAVSAGVAKERIEFWTSETTGAARTVKMTIKSSGRVGIGTVAPATFLHVLGTTEQLRLGFDTSNFGKLTVDSGGQLIVNATGAMTFSPASGSDINIGVAGSTNTLRIQRLANATALATTQNSNNIALRGAYWNGSASTIVDSAIYEKVVDVTPTYGIALSVGGTDRMFVNNSGNVLIGTTSNLTNGGKLQVVGAADAIQFLLRANATQTATNMMELQTSGGTAVLSVSGTGDVGIGVAPSTRALNISQTSATRTSVVRVLGTFNPGSAQSSYFPTSLSPTSKYNSTFNSTGLLECAFFETNIINSGTLPVRTVDIYSSNESTGTVATMWDLNIRTGLNSGGGVVTQKIGLNIQDQTIGASNLAINTGLGLVHFGDSVDLASGKSLTILAANIITDTTTGMTIWSAANQKGAFWGAGAIVQPANTVALDTLLVNIGLRASGGVALFDTDVKVGVVGKGIYIKEGTNARQGVVTLVAGTATVATTAVGANSRIWLTPQTLGTILRPAGLGVTAVVNGTSFTITSSDITDTSTVAWMITESM